MEPPHMNFESFSSSRRRQQSADATAAAAAAAAGAAPASSPGQLAAGASSPTHDAFRASFAFQRLFLLVVFADAFLCVAAVVHLAFARDVEAWAAASRSETTPRVTLPAFRIAGTAISYLGVLVWLVSFGELAVYAVAAFEQRSASALRVADGLLVVLHGALLALRAPPLARLLAVVGRAARVAACLRLAEGELAQRTMRLDARYLEQRNRSELLQSQLEQTQSKLGRELESRRQVEESLARLRDANEELNEALELAALEVHAHELAAATTAAAATATSVAGGSSGSGSASPSSALLLMQQLQQQQLLQAPRSLGRSTASSRSIGSSSGVRVLPAASKAHEHGHRHGGSAAAALRQQAALRQRALSAALPLATALLKGGAGPSATSSETAAGVAELGRGDGDRADADVDADEDADADGFEDARDVGVGGAGGKATRVVISRDGTALVR